ncbi:Rha family transcriptional regulator [Heyndrickxia sporothermodurans]|uniref:Rha family transcriptional regulator n=1 Tax=Heyndrickxia sporothermodurans TaxID=46224 RepID=A0AB37HI20_9BACI|nr:Rha family transcriptional regulator [Heyndrickxia sporothermodurans]MED1711758.1 Rha family transcriptional regulator [Bacillus thuringiensis]MBL5768017.1 Rha family transcriptional regulator [Heyndrickxia sporothermodurans]MBL5771611.1 Rha family transcriptional regulator [Heyndrickxia sporothermodurans]MBL5785897.1 Rha family transcriptional regulator [Heyndrickxia sporothermodurans]MBL5789403.1 Rha family transcriptional regulator [Heyndrickxia sporothermodurans]
MTQLVFIQNNKPVTDSLTVADVFNKNHNHVLRDIESQLEKLKQAGEHEWGVSNFGQTQYQHHQNKQWYTKYDLTEDAFTLIAMSYTTPEAMKMKVRFIQEFKKMREYIQNKVTPLSKDQALVTVLRTTADLVEDTQAIKEEQHEIRKMITHIDNKVEEQITLDHGEQRRLQKGIAAKVYELCDDPKERPKLFKEIYREIKDRFGVASYKDVKRKELQSAIRYVENWIPRRVS